MTLFSLIGSMLGAAPVFVILFVIVEYIRCLKLFPETKYVGAWLIGVVFFAYGIWNKKFDETGAVAIVIVSGLALLYALGGAKRGREWLTRVEEKAGSTAAGQNSEGNKD